MALIQVQQPWDAQPQEAATPSPAFAGGVVWLPTSSHITPTLSGVFGASSAGVGATYTANRSDAPTVSWWPSVGGFTAIAVVDANNTTTSGVCFYSCTSGSENGASAAFPGLVECHFGANFAAGQWHVTLDLGEDAETSSLNGGTVVANRPTVLAVTYEGGSSRFFVDGVVVATASRTPTSWAAPTFHRVASTGSGSVVRNWRGNLYAFGRSTEALPDALVPRTPADAYATLFAPRRIPVPVSAGGASGAALAGYGLIDATGIGTLTTRATLAGAGLSSFYGFGSLGAFGAYVPSPKTFSSPSRARAFSSPSRAQVLASPSRAKSFASPSRALPAFASPSRAQAFVSPRRAETFISPSRAQAFVSPARIF